MKGRVKGSDQDVTYRDHIQNKNLFQKIIKHHINSFIQVLYTTHSVRESNTLKLVNQQHAIARVSPMDLLDCDP